MENIDSTQTAHKSRRGGLVAGIILICIGVGMLAAQAISLEGFFPMILGAAFLISGIVTRRRGLIIPGGIIGGLGLAIAVLENRLVSMAQPEEGGLFLVIFALGWFSITLLTALFTSKTEWWPLIPGGILAVVGGLVMVGGIGLTILELIGQYWPLILVLIGAVIVIRYFSRSK